MVDYNYIIKLGSNNTLIVKAGDGLVCKEPSVVAVSNDKKGNVLACGNDAYDLVNSGTDCTLVYPVSDGVIRNKSYATAMLRAYLQKIEFKTLFTKNNVVMLVPSSISESEKNDYVNVGYSCMFTSVELLPTLFAGMVNMEIDESDIRNHIICKLGGGTTDVGVISAGRIVDAITVDIGGNTLDSAIKQYIEDSYHVSISSADAEKIKCELATLLPNDVKTYNLFGSSGNSEYGDIVLTSGELRPIFMDYFSRIAGIIGSLISSLEPSVALEVSRRGLYLFGSSSDITGVDKYLHSVLGIPVYVDVEPSTTVYYGATTMLNNPKLINTLIDNYIG